ncbi:MAG: hypothetical protein HY287_00640 [Planctomycetes bacterium]|nr:hypothetical protein [Planctomycetota bacterium]
MAATKTPREKSAGDGVIVVGPANAPNHSDAEYVGRRAKEFRIVEDMLLRVARGSGQLDFDEREFVLCATKWPMARIDSTIGGLRESLEKAQRCGTRSDLNVLKERAGLVERSAEETRERLRPELERIQSEIERAEAAAGEARRNCESMEIANHRMCGALTGLFPWLDSRREWRRQLVESTCRELSEVRQAIGRLDSIASIRFDEWDRVKAHCAHLALIDEALETNSDGWPTRCVWDEYITRVNSPRDELVARGRELEREKAAAFSRIDAEFVEEFIPRLTG